MNYSEAVNYLYQVPRFTKKTSLQHTKELLKVLGDPHKGLRFIHVAGTNGKGSVCAFLNSVFTKGGYSCAMFTSPHLVSINERFKINGKNIDNSTFTKAFLKVKEAWESIETEHPTYFEILFLMAMLIFRDAAPDVVLLETGLGGRLDATNVIEEPLACIITSISRDHCMYLGDTIEEIAFEKAGIIKPGAILVYDAKDPVSARVIESEAKRRGARAYPVRAWDHEVITSDTEGVVFSFRYRGGTHELAASLAGKHQAVNASLAYAAARELGDVLPVSEDQIASGLRDTVWPGRMESLRGGIFLDGAHNEDAIRKFIDAARDVGNGKQSDLLFAAASDKDYPGMIRLLTRELKPVKVVTTRIPGKRGVPADELKKLFEAEGCACAQAVDDIKEAFKKACGTRENDLLFCVGSLYLIGEIKAFLGDGKEGDEQC